MLLYLPGDVMNLINERNSDIVDVYITSIRDISYNSNKFEELTSYNNLKLDKEFICLNKYNKYILNCKAPLQYPISTLLLASYIPDMICKYVDNDIASYIYYMLTIYEPDDLFAIYNLIGHNRKIDRCISDVELNKLLKDIDDDLCQFREIFNHIEFKYIGSYDIGGLDRYLKIHANGIIPKEMYEGYKICEEAKRNSKVLEKLKLVPNRIK